MIDIHHHLLFGIDDGSKSLEQSVAMVQMAVEDGITHIVATPHANDIYSYNRERNAALLQEIREALPPEIESRIKLGLGCDFHLNFDNTEDARIHKTRYTINETEYLLIELPDIGIPPRLEDVLHKLRIDGFTPILTHPERNRTLQRTPEMLNTWLGDGLLLQITAGSVTGTFGPSAESMAWNLLKKGSVHFIATDAHNLERRPPRMSVARELIADRMGSDVAESLCVTNPLAVFEGRPMPEPSLAMQDLADDLAAKKPSLWKRIFG